jgi:hypothetical protein
VPLPYYLFGFIAIQGDTETGRAVAGTLDETISKYEQEKGGASAAYASPWVFTAHNNTPKCTPAGALCILHRNWGMSSPEIPVLVCRRRMWF